MQVFNNKKSNSNLLIIILAIVILCTIGILYLLFRPNKTNDFEELLKKNLVVEKTYKNDAYSLKVKKIDDYSFDRILEVDYNDKKIDFDLIKYSDGVTTCSGERPITYYGNISKEKELIIVLKDKSEIKIKIGEEK